MKQITTDQVANWLKKHSKQIAECDSRTSHLGDNHSFVLGVAISTLTEVLNDANYRKQFLKEVGL